MVAGGLVDPSLTGSLDSSALAGLDEVLLDVADQPEDREKNFAHQIGAIEHDGGIVDAQNGPLFDDALCDGEKVTRVTSQPVRMEGEEFRAGFEQADRSFQLVPTGRRLRNGRKCRRE